MKEKTKIESLNLTEDNILKLKKIFPEVVIDGLIDFEKLKLLLGEGLENKDESYKFEWVGKRDCYKLLQTPSLATLNFYKEESLNPDNNENLIIEGDNLEVLKLLQANYKSQIKMIYLDPPYNRDSEDLVYRDNYTISLQNYFEITGQTTNGDSNVSSKSKAGRKHTDWLNMIFPRVTLLRSLLSDDGVVFISIDDNELHNLITVCIEVFGEENHVATLPTVMNLKGNQDEFGFAGTHEYTVVFAKNKDKCNLNQFNVDDNQILKDWQQDEYGLWKEGRSIRATGDDGKREKRESLFYPIFINQQNEIYVTDDDKPLNNKDKIFLPIDNMGNEMRWSWSKDKVKNESHDLIPHEKNNFTKKQRPTLGDIPTSKPKTVFYKPIYSSGNGTNEMKKIFGERIFSNPKPKELIKDFIRIGSGRNDLILDIFAGSGTLAQSVLELNEEEDSNRRFILIQLPEVIKNEKKQKELYKFLKSNNLDNNLAEVAKERTRRVIKGYGENPKKLNSGFKVFKLKQSNYQVVNEIEKHEDSDRDELISSIRKRIQNSLISDNSLIENYKEIDVVYETLLKEGFSLNSNIEKIKIKKNVLYRVSDNKEKNKLIYVCFEKLHKETIDGKEFTNIEEDTLLICFDIYLTDSDKANLSKTFKIKTM